MVIVIFIQVYNRIRILFCGFADIWICVILESERDGIFNADSYFYYASRYGASFFLCLLFDSNKDWTALGRKARKYYIATFSVEKVMNKLEKILTENC